MFKRFLKQFVFVAILLLLGFGVKSAVTVGADSLPNTQAPLGFALTSVVENLAAPTSAQFAPDGRIFIAQKDGTVLIHQNGLLIADPFYALINVNNYGDRGLLSIALDPNFAINHYVYLLYTYDNNPSDIAGPKTARLIRVTANGNVAVPGSEVVLLGTQVGNSVQTSCQNFPVTADCIPSDGLSHTVGTVLFGSDGKLYISIGDAAGYDDLDVGALRSQNLDSLSGKILRINPDGTAPADNPYYNGQSTANRSKVFAYGLRNPFRMSVRASDGLIMAGDVGWNTWEEINVVSRGSNLGWPCYEANDHQNGTGVAGTGAYKDLPECIAMYQSPPSNLTYPIHYYPHPPSSAVVSGVFYTGTNYPAQYNNKFFYGDYAQNKINSLQLSATNTLVADSDAAFAFNAGGPVAFFKGLDGDIYYLAINLGAIYHITYSANNQAPTAIASSDKQSGIAPLAVNFSSAGSFDPDNDPITYSWNFGDGSPVSNTPNPQHTYTLNGVYTATLTVTDNTNNSSVKNLDIHVGQTPPTVTIISPSPLTTANADDVINFSGTATDVIDGTIARDKLKWEIIINHCPLNSCHVHEVNNVTGNSGTFLFPHHDGPFNVLINLSVTNSNNLTSTQSVRIYPIGQEITSSLMFDGINDYATAAAPADFSLQQFTAEAVIKTFTTDDWGSEVVSMGNNWTMRVMPSGNILFSFNSNNSWQNLLTTSVNAKDGLWHHVAITRTTNSMKIYFDGAIKAQSENTNPIQYIYGTQLTVGKHGDGDDHFHFNGAIDEIRVWSQPRTDAEILTSHTSTLPTTQANLIAYYKADEGTGLIAVDSTALHAHNITLQNGTTWTSGAPLSSPSQPSVPITDIGDSFNGTTIDQLKWDVYLPADRTIQNNDLTITPTSNSAGYYGISSKGRYELKNNSIFLEMPQATAAGTTAETQFILEPNEYNKLVIGKTGNALHMRIRTNDVNADTFINYDVVTMRWLRLREANGSVFYETSPDAITWTIRRTVIPTFDLSRLEVILQAGTYQQVASPGLAKFDNLNIQPVVLENKAVSFDGVNGQAALSSTTVNYTAQALSVELWAKIDATGIWGGELISNGNNYGLRVLPDGNVRFFIHTGGLIWQNYETTGINLKDNQWHHIAATKNGTEVKIYIDGQLISTHPSTQAISYTLGKNLVIGRHGDGDNNFNLKGSIDEIRIWDIVRSTTNIQRSYSLELPPQANLVANWRINEGSGSSLVNQVDATKPLLLSGIYTWVTGYPNN